MVEQRDRLGFTQEAGFFALVTKRIGREKLQRDSAFEPDVLGLVDNTHRAFAELVDDAVMRDGVANHGS